MWCAAKKTPRQVAIPYRKLGEHARPRARSKPFGRAFSLLGLAGLALSCSDDPKPRGQLMIAITTDMSITKDLDEVRVEISRADGTKIPDRQIPILPSQPAPFGKPLPGTIAIVPADAGGQALHVRLTARHLDPASGERKSRVVREAIVKVPTDRVALLRMPLRWLCDGQVVAAEGDSFRSDCAENETCKAGVCQPADVDANDMPDYSAAQVFGGGEAHGIGSRCLDAQACFADAQVLAPDSSDCTVPLPDGADPSRLNVALVMPPESAGHCPDDTAPSGHCYLPLDSDPEEGFSISDGRLKLPAAACQRPGVLGFRCRRPASRRTYRCPFADHGRAGRIVWTRVRASAARQGSAARRRSAVLRGSAAAPEAARAAAPAGC